MSRRYLIIIVIAALLFIGGMVFLNSKGKSSASGTTTSTKSGLSTLFPFLSSNSGTTASSTPSTAGTFADVLPPVVSNGPTYFKQISSNMVAGLVALPFDASAAAVVSHGADGSTTTVVNLPKVRYAEQGTGYIYDIAADGTNETKASSTVIAGTAIAQFGQNGTTAILRYVKPDNTTVGTFLGTVTPPADPAAGIAGTLAGSFLPDGIIDVAVSPDGKNFAYVAPITGGSVGMSIKTDGTGKKQLFESPFSEWLITWTASGLVATTKAASDIPGYAYKVSSTGGFGKVLGPTPGLTTLASPDGKEILYGVGTGTTMQLHIRTLKNTIDTSTGLSTLPEKCAWASDSSAIYCGVPQYVPTDAYPDSWYQGIEHFNDAIWKIDPSTGVTTKLTTGSEGLVDATDLTLSADGSYLFTVNKTDGTLWSLDLAGVTKAAH